MSFHALDFLEVHLLRTRTELIFLLQELGFESHSTGSPAKPKLGRVLSTPLSFVPLSSTAKLPTQELPRVS